jgi:uncharacterized coiled-coil DUF342 family protein
MAVRDVIQAAKALEEVQNAVDALDAEVDGIQALLTAKRAALQNARDRAATLRVTLKTEAAKLPDA